MAKQTIELKLYASELLYDFRVKLAERAAAAYTDETQEKTAQLSENTEEQENTAMRSIQTSFAIIRKTCADLLTEDTPHADNILMSATRPKESEDTVYGYAGHAADPDKSSLEDNTLTLRLRVTSNFNPSVRDTLAATMHTYIVSSALAEWLKLHAAAEAETYAAEATNALIALNDALSARTRPRRTRLPQQDYHNTTNDKRYE